MIAVKDVQVLEVIERSLQNMPLCLHKPAATWAAEGILKAFKRAGIVCEQDDVPDVPARRLNDNKPKEFNHG